MHSFHPASFQLHLSLSQADHFNCKALLAATIYTKCPCTAPFQSHPYLGLSFCQALPILPPCPNCPFCPVPTLHNPYPPNKDCESHLPTPTVTFIFSSKCVIPFPLKASSFPVPSPDKSPSHPSPTASPYLFPSLKTRHPAPSSHQICRRHQIQSPLLLQTHSSPLLNPLPSPSPTKFPQH